MPLSLFGLFFFFQKLVAYVLFLRDPRAPLFCDWEAAAAAVTAGGGPFSFVMGVYPISYSSSIIKLFTASSSFKWA